MVYDWLRSVHQGQLRSVRRPRQGYSGGAARAAHIQALEPRVLLTVSPVEVVVAGDTVHPGEQLVTPPTSVTVVFSGDLATTGAGDVTSAANWDLTRNDLDANSLISGISFGFNGVTSQYEAVVTFTGPLTPADYVLTAKGTITDPSSNPLIGGDYARDLTVRTPQVMGTEYRVNTHTTNNQETFSQSPGAVAMDAAGNYVVVWNSNLQDGSERGIYAQRYNAAGMAQGSEFRVNATTAGEQRWGSVAMDADGNFVVTWTSYGQDGDNDGVFARRYNAAGAALSGEFQVNVYTTSTQRYSNIAMDADGDFVITWTSFGQDGDNEGIYARRYNASGVAQGGEFAVNTYTTESQERSTVAMDADGNFVIVWESRTQEGAGTNFGIYARRYQADGTAIDVNEFQVNTHTASNQRHARVAMDQAGNFVIIWASSGQDGSGYGIYAQRYNASGTPLGAEFQVNTYTTGAQTFSTIAMDDDGDFVIAWDSVDQDGSGTGIYAQRYSAAGVTLGGEFRVNTHTTGDQFIPAAAMNADGDFVIVWSGTGATGSPRDVFAQRYAGGIRPSDITLTNNSVLENRPANTLVGLLGNNDPDSPEAHSYQLVSGAGDADNASFLIVGNELRTNASFDHEATPTRTIRVRVTDIAGLTYDRQLTIDILDAPEFHITESGGETIVSEHGLPAQKTDTFTVVLDTAPTSNVVLNVVSNDPGEATVSVSTLTFTPGNWNVAQMVTVSGVFDNLTDGNQNVTITVSVNTGLSDPLYHDAPNVDVSVTVRDVANRPVVTGPIGAGQPAFPTFTWDAVVPGATSYALWLINKTTGTLVFQRSDISAAATSYLLTATDVGAGGLADGEYRFWMNSVSTHGYSQSGLHTDFTVGTAVTPPTVPTGFSLTNPESLTPTINWGSVSGATTYSIYLINLDTSAVISGATGLTSANFTPASPLATGNKYRIWVKAHNSAGSSAWSTPYDFDVGVITPPASAPSGFSTSDSGNPLRPQINWGPVSGATNYSIYLINLTTGAVISGATGLASTSFTPTADLASATYRIWVKAHNAAGSSGWSAPFNFDVAMPVPPTPPTGFSVLNANTASPTVTWNAVPGATHYAIWFINLDTNTLVSGATGLTTNSFTASGLTSGNYRIWVRAYNGTGSSTWSSPFDFDVTVP
jgi:hypothetical protein